MVSSLKLETANGQIEISSLKSLLDYLIGIKQESIEIEISKNEAPIINWIESQFPGNLRITASLKSHRDEFSPQQKRELMIREIRIITG
jgi:hypothetical protein